MSAPGSAFLLAIKRAGGIAPSLLADMSQEKGHLVNRRLPGLVNRCGFTEDALVEWLGQNGYITQAMIDEADESGIGGSHELAYSLVRSAIEGHDVYQLGDESGWYSERAEAEFQDAQREMINEARIEGLQEMCIRMADAAPMRADYWNAQFQKLSALARQYLGDSNEYA